MVLATKPGGLVCTVIDDGALNTDTAAATRKWLMEHARVKAVVSLPAVTFKPNKITVKASVLLLERFDETLEDSEGEYQITYATFDTLGFHSSGELIRNFDFDTLRKDFRDLVVKPPTTSTSRNNLRTFPLSSHVIVDDGKVRPDYKYWDATVRERIE
jgi:type I restriction enzyme M protein